MLLVLLVLLVRRFVLLLGCIFVLLVLLVSAKSFGTKKTIIKNKEFKTALIASFTLLLQACISTRNICI